MMSENIHVELLKLSAAVPRRTIDRRGAQLVLPTPREHVIFPTNAAQFRKPTWTSFIARIVSQGMALCGSEHAWKRFGRINGNISPGRESRFPYPTSLHQGGVHVLMVDGGVTFVDESIDGAVWAAMVTPDWEGERPANP
ncbi:MAG: DUF1559 domain-containing protein [Planctomycetota bacterium]